MKFQQSWTSVIVTYTLEDIRKRLNLVTECSKAPIEHSDTLRIGLEDCLFAYFDFNYTKTIIQLNFNNHGLQ